MFTSGFVVFANFQSKDITLLAKVCLVKAMDFPVVIYGCESWTIKKVEHWRIDAFELWCWRRFLRVTWTARRSNQSILREINPELFTGRTEAEAEAPILWPHDAKSQFTGKDPNAGKDGRQKEKEAAEDEMVEWHHWLDGLECEPAPGAVMDRKAWPAAVHGVAELDMTKRMNNYRNLV